MATLLLTGIVGPAIHANSFWMGVLSMGGGTADSYLFAPSSNFTQEGARLNDLRLTTSTNGASVPVVYGTVRLAGNVVWGTNYVEHRHEDTQSSGGGKGGGGGTSVTTVSYTYTVSFAIVLCEGPITSIGKVWADGKQIDLANYQYTLHIGTDGQEPDPWMEAIEGAGNVPAYRGLAYIVFKNFDVTDYGNRIPAMTFEITRDMTNLKDIVEEISAQAGLDAVDIDASDLDGLAVQGYWVSGDKSFRNRIEQLQILNSFDGVERGGKVVFTQRDITNSIQIPVEDLGAFESSRPKELYTKTRKQETELPQLVTINYISADKDYQTGTMPAKRQATRSLNEVTINLDMVLTDARAKALAETKLYEAWISRTSYELQTGTKYGAVGPGQVVKLVSETRSDLILVTRSTFGRPGINKVQAIDIGKATYLASRNVDSEVVPGLPGEVPLTGVDILDLPRLPWDADTTDHVYLSSTGSPFYGANIFRSDDGGATFRIITQDTLKSSKGHAVTVLAPGTTFFFDAANTVEVVMASGTLSGRPKADVLNGFNAALLGNEIIQWTTAELIAANTYRLSGLLRGRLGTEHETGTHVAGEKFCVLSQNMSKLPLPTSDWYREVLFRAGSSIAAVTDSTYRDLRFAGQGTAARPFSVCHIKGTRNTNGDVILSWIRRTRGDGSWKPYAEVPLSEASERYEIEILSGEAVVRTLTASEPAAAYTAGQQAADFGGLQMAGTLKVRIYQISETRGRGIGKEMTV